MRGFTLAELLISLVILGVIATFTIPKVLQVQQEDRFNTIARETMAMISGAYDAYRLNRTPDANLLPADLTPFMNYVRPDTSMTVDDRNEATTRACTVASSNSCIVLHNGGVLRYNTGEVFGGTNNTNAIWFALDPDGKVTDSSTNGPGKSVMIFLYHSGRIATYGTISSNTRSGAGGVIVRNPQPTYDPIWLHWD